jgi:hypothetical protein
MPRAPAGAVSKRLGRMPEQALQRFDSGVSLALSKFGQSRGGERDLGERWHPLINEPLEPPQRGSLVTSRVVIRKQLAQQERIGER